MPMMAHVWPPSVGAQAKVYAMILRNTLLQRPTGDVCLGWIVPAQRRTSVSNRVGL
jgi:hypothetical protein